jgi:hypothetical protein
MSGRNLTAQELEALIKAATAAKLEQAEAEDTLHEGEVVAGIAVKVVATSKRKELALVDVPDPPGRRPVYDRRAIEAALNAGLSNNAIHREFGMDRKRVGQIRAEMGLPPWDKRGKQ